MSSQNNNQYYQTREQRLDTVAGDNSYWKKLMAAREEYFEIKGQYDAGFYLWLEETYGVRPFVTESAITAKFDVVDEQKYIIFNLKF
jgi:hypothetical protein